MGKNKLVVSAVIFTNQGEGKGKGGLPPQGLEGATAPSGGVQVSRGLVNE